MYLLLFKFASIQVLFQQHFYRFAVLSVAIAILLKVVLIVLRNSLFLQSLAFLTLASLASWYLGTWSVLLISVLFSASYIIGSWLLNKKEPLVGVASGFFLLLQLYIIAGLLQSPSVGLQLVQGLSFGILIFYLWTYKGKNNLFRTVVSGLSNVLLSLSTIELVLIILAVIYGSFPQTAMNWDSVYANLYNARWYVELNSLKPLEESISSIFPQHAILYYSLFYAIGGLRSLQVAYIFPLILLFGIVKLFFRKLKVSWWYEHVAHLLLFVPIVLAQSSSGYYDMFIASLLILSIYTLVYADFQSFIKKVIFTSLFLGITIASKYFTIVCVPFLFLGICIEAYHQRRQKHLVFRLLTFIMISLVLCFGPLAIWTVRSYVNTGSPVFPFFQNVFRTNELWSSGNSVEQNPMTQTSMSRNTWLKGGFFLYPITTYFRTEFYVEGTRGYPGVIYIVLLPLQVFLLVQVFWKMLKRKTEIDDWIFLSLFLSYVGVGIIARYYRYIWPFQFVFGVLTFVQFWQYMKRIKIHAVLVLVVLITFYAIHAVDLMESFRFVPEQPKAYMFHPEYYLTSADTPVFSVINNSAPKKPILDVSQYMVSRLYFAPRTYMCNWYWVAGDRKVAQISEDEEKTREFLQQFSYVITSEDPIYTGNYCAALVKKAKSLRLVGQDTYHRIYKVE